MTPQLFTSRYAAGALVAASGLAPVRSSVGFPRFKLRFEPAGACKLLMPERASLGLPEPEYRKLDEAKLDAAGPDRILAELSAISAQAGGKGLVLLCFEDLTKSGQWCHRRMAARWLEGKTGEAVPGLGGFDAPKAGAVSRRGTLF